MWQDVAKEVGKRVLAEGLHALGTQLIKVSEDLGRPKTSSLVAKVNGITPVDGAWSNPSYDLPGKAKPV